MPAASPEGPSGLSRSVGTAALLVAALAAIGFILIARWGGEAAQGRDVQVLAEPMAFVGASADRRFLNNAESVEAARRGLAPPRTRSIIATGGRLAHGTWRWDEAGVPAGPVTVRVDLERQLVSVFRGPDEIGTAVVVYGTQDKETPRGKLPILGKSRDYHSITYDAPMPFSLWLRTDGVALHGSNVRMGRATNGCIGVPVEFARRLFGTVRKGDIVEVLDSRDRVS